MTRRPSWCTIAKFAEQDVSQDSTLHHGRDYNPRPYKCKAGVSVTALRSAPQSSVISSFHSELRRLKPDLEFLVPVVHMLSTDYQTDAVIWTAGAYTMVTYAIYETHPQYYNRPHFQATNYFFQKRVSKNQVMAVCHYTPKYTGRYASTLLINPTPCYAFSAQMH